MAHTTFALSAPSACSATATNGYKGEARAYREKLSKAKPRDSKGVVCRGLPWVLFWPEILLTRSRWITFQTFVPFHSIADAGRMQSASGLRDSATNRLGEHGGMGLGPMLQECKVLHDEAASCGRHF